MKFALEHRAYLWNPAPSTYGNKEREILATFKTRKENKEKEVENFFESSIMRLATQPS